MYCMTQSHKQVQDKTKLLQERYITENGCYPINGEELQIEEIN
jgi:hypothetical protein